MLRLSQSATAAPAIPSRSSVETKLPVRRLEDDVGREQAGKQRLGPVQLLGLAFGDRRGVVDAAADPDELAALAIEEVERFGTSRARPENPKGLTP